MVSLRCQTKHVSSCPARKTSLSNEKTLAKQQLSELRGDLNSCVAVAIRRAVMHAVGAQLAYVNLASAAQQDFHVGAILGPS
eukprot:4153326-Alexandrium_andersonii.AAC.1